MSRVLKMHRRGLRAALALVLVSPVLAWAEEVTFESLLAEMQDLERLARFPEPMYLTRQASSYDRNATDATVLTDDNWFANGDRGQHVRVEERNGASEYVMLDQAGPGAIVRIWSANPVDAGVVRVYLDGADEPAIEMQLTDMLGGEHFPFVGPIAGKRSEGWNSHLPIPYAKHCKITASKPDFYYQVNYRTYEPGTRVQTYSWKVVDNSRNAIERIADDLRAPVASRVHNGKLEKHTIELAPGEKHVTTLDAGGGGRAIKSFSVRVDSEDMAAALRACLLTMRFDDAEEGQVAAPLGDFFGMAPGINPYDSLPMDVAEDGTMTSRWVMPFRDVAEMVFTNTGDIPLRADVEIGVAPFDWDERTLYFNAGWRSETDINTRPRQDWNYVTIDGKGRYLGNMLHIVNPTPAWWGEGDEKIYLDGEDFPSTFGTGTEDYYGYAWCSPQPFTHAYHNQPRCDGPGNYGHTSVNRFHIIDDLPFTESLRFDMEVWHWEEVQVSMAATSYWYAAAGASDNLPSPPEGQLKVAHIEEFEPPVVEGAIEGEDLEVLEVTGGVASVQANVAWKWSGMEQLWWIDAKPGDKLALALPVEKSGRYAVQAKFTKAFDYGIAQLRINGEPAGAPIDFYNTGVQVTEPVSLGEFALAAGVARLEVEIVGANPKAHPRHMFGLDCVILEPID